MAEKRAVIKKIKMPFLGTAMDDRLSFFCN
jgi:hypothetical protein